MSRKLNNAKNQKTALSFVPATLSNEEQKQTADHKESEIPPFPPASLNLLTTYAGRFKRLSGEQIIVTSYETECDVPSHIDLKCTKLSTDTILRLAGEKFIQFPTRSSKSQVSALGCEVFDSFSGISEEYKTDVQLVLYLLASAEKVGEKQFDSARKLLEECDKLSSNQGDPVQRLVYYFSEALRQKIDKEMGKTASSNNLWENPLLEIQKALLSPITTVLAFHQVVPFSQVAQFSGVQVILDHVSHASKIHIIDLAIRCGIHFTALMQALAARNEYPIEHLKITAIETNSKAKVDETGKRLMSFAQSLNLPFSFEAIIVEDIFDLEKSLFLLDCDEVVAIYSPFFLMTMLAQPDRLESLMRAIRSINPRVMIVNEVEGNHNSPVFVTRFIEALFFYGACFDSLEDCMKDDESNRVNQESFYFGKGIRNIVAAEGAERIIRHVNFNVWRAFFARFGMVEVELSMQSVDYAKLVRKNFACGNSCTLDMDGKCMIIGWKGTPVHSLSAWKFT